MFLIALHVLVQIIVQNVILDILYLVEVVQNQLHVTFQTAVHVLVQIIVLVANLVILYLVVNVLNLPNLLHVMLLIAPHVLVQITVQAVGAIINFRMESVYCNVLMVLAMMTLVLLALAGIHIPTILHQIKQQLVRKKVHIQAQQLKQVKVRMNVNIRAQ